MKDHTYVDDYGKRTPISELSDFELQECLKDEIYIHASSDQGVTIDDVRKRLELELFIRREGLRK